MKKLGAFFGFLLILLTLGILIFTFIHSPQYEGEISLNGLSEETTVYFDEYGIPHIYAANEADAYRAFGYLHAQDRLFQLEMMRRVGTGTLAEFLGPDLLEIDQFFRTLGIPEHARSSTEVWNSEPDSPWKIATEAYIAGVNEFIQQGSLPVEYTLLGETPREFTINDIHAITGYMSFTFAMALKTDPLVTQMSRKLGPKYLDALSIQTLPEHHFIPNFYPDTIKNESLISLLKKLPVPLLEGSNGWVISGSKTKSGKVIFANDTHIGFSSPSVWYEAHLEYPGFSFYGNHLAGVPFGLVGHSRHHSVGLTMFENDDQDFFEVELNPNNPNEYRFGEEYLPFTSRQEKIPVKDQEPVDFEIKETIHGPVMNSVVPEIQALTSNPVSSWWVYTQEPTRALEAMYKINHAKNIEDVANAVSLIHAPGLNIMYGDSLGNIAWWAAAKLPIRSEKVHSKIFANGSDPETMPQGWYPFSVNPMSVNPPSGFVASANNQPDTLRNGVFFPGYYYPGERWKRIADAINSKNDWTLEAMKAVQLEVINSDHPQIAKIMLQQLPDFDFGDKESVKAKLENWDGNHELNSIAPTVYYKWLYHTLRLAMEDELGKDAFENYLGTFMMIRSNLPFVRNLENPWWDNVHTPEKETASEIFAESLKITLEELEAQLGKNVNSWYWEKVVVAEHPHPLGSKKPLDKLFNVITSPIPANDESINKLAFKLNGEGIYRVTSGPAMRILLDFMDVDRSLSVLPTGQSGNRFSKHYKDQASLYAKGKYRYQLMDKEDILEESKDPLIFKPN
ncbi:penicillin acylase family protein [Algoriphagus kandeliae]|uniref:Penicillin acylase family protein n=1 Tax=Algoriphagus kandeliae TaxID=2562278 RepID=A0A4Y9R0S7_9BACT|nr:penicillin acylase family protein [Algoriphagus kandeliae]TFV97442.1 penicillin acylase family protein [Algoriphagus kandeliae]